MAGHCKNVQGAFHQRSSHNQQRISTLTHVPSRNPNISAYEAVHGPYNWNHFLLAPPGCKAVVYKSPETQGLWGSRGIDACWCIGPSLDQYQCNHFFILETQAYQIFGSAKLFPQHCQVPFLLWNKHLHEVTDKLVTMLKELPGPKRSSVLDNIKSRLETYPWMALTSGQPTKGAHQCPPWTKGGTNGDTRLSFQCAASATYHWSATHYDGA